MEREKFVKLVKEALDALPTRFRKRIHNVTVLVEDLPPGRLTRRKLQERGQNLAFVGGSFCEE